MTGGWEKNMSVPHSLQHGRGSGKGPEGAGCDLGVPGEVRLLLALEKERAEADRWVSLSGEAPSSLFQCVGTVEAVTTRQESFRKLAERAQLS